MIQNWLFSETTHAIKIIIIKIKSLGTAALNMNRFPRNRI